MRDTISELIATCCFVFVLNRFNAANRTDNIFIMTVVKEFMHTEKEKLDEIEVAEKPEGKSIPQLCCAKCFWCRFQVAQVRNNCIISFHAVISAQFVENMR